MGGGAIRRGGACVLAVLAVPAAPAAANLTSAPLRVAQPRVVALPPQPTDAPIDLSAGPRGWRGRLSHLAGTSHYDRGEWIYEDYPMSAYGAASPAMAQTQQGLGALGQLAPQAQRLPGGVAEVQATTGAGPLVDEADVWQLRVAVRDGSVYVLARTTTMHSPARTALLLLFDTRPGAQAHDVPFGSGLHSTLADVAVLVTPAGARIVDLASGATTQAPATADPAGYANSLVTRLPLDALSAPGATELRFAGAAGLVAPGSFALEPGGTAGPLAKVVPRSEPAVQAVFERAQALALAAHDIDAFFTPVSLARLRDGDCERLLPGAGYSVRTVVAPAARSKSEGGTDGTLRDYGLYVPQGLDGRPAPATLLLRGSGMTAHSLAAITPGLVRQLGDDNHAIVVSPGGRSGFDLFAGAAYLDAFQALDDAERLLPVDRDRVSVAGYSMGGYSTYMFAATRPDRFAGAFVVEGPVGGAQPATKTPVIDAFADVVPMLANLQHEPIAIYQGDHDADVPITNALASTQRLRDLGYRYRLNVFGGDHFTPGVFDDYAIGARYLRGLRRDPRPAEVRLTRDMTFERAIATGAYSDQPLAGHDAGLRFDHAWYVHGLTPADRRAGTATIDVRSDALAGAGHSVTRALGVDPPGPDGGAPPSLFDEQRWQPLPATAPGNAFGATLSGVASVTLDLAAMGLTTGRALDATLDTDTRATVTLAAGHGRRIDLCLGPGRHRLTITSTTGSSPCA